MEYMAKKTVNIIMIIPYMEISENKHAPICLTEARDSSIYWIWNFRYKPSFYNYAMDLIIYTLACIAHGYF